MVCLKCGTENPEGSIFCNKCGTKLTEPDIKVIDKDDLNSSTKEQSDIKDNNFVRNLICRTKSLNTKWKIILGSILSLVIIIGIGYKIIEPPSPEKVFEKVKDYKTQDELSYLNKVYPDNGGFLGLFKQKNNKNKIKTLSLLIDYNNDKFESETGMSISDYTAVKITNVDIEYKDYDSDYVDIKVTINNGGKTPVNYIKINLYYKDDAGNTIRSDWTNDDSVIQPGASQIITKMTENDGWKSVHAEIAEIN